MADTKISALTDGGNLQLGDELAIARASTSYRAVLLMDGWVDDTAETWTYASGSGGGTATFTVTGDQTAKYTTGTRIKLTQTTVKYFVVASSSVAAGTTTVTITGGSDYTLANAAISANYHSYMSNPQGYPGWFNFAAAVTGYASTTDVITKFAVVGKEVSLWLYIRGTSNATTLTLTLPIAAASGTSNTNWSAIVRIASNAAFASGLAAILTNTSTTVLNVFATAAAGAFANTGIKVLEAGIFNYPI